MCPSLSSFQGCTTVSPAPHQEPVLLLLQATSSSALASCTRCVSPAAAHRSVMGLARGNGHNHQLPLAWASRSSRCFLSTCFCRPRCADRPAHTELRWSSAHAEETNWIWVKWESGRYINAYPSRCVATLRVFLLPGHLSSFTSSRNKAVGRFHHHMSRPHTRSWRSFKGSWVRWCGGWWGEEPASDRSSPLLFSHTTRWKVRLHPSFSEHSE